MSKMNEYYQETYDSYLETVAEGIETGIITQGDMEALLVLTGHEYLTIGRTSRWVKTQEGV